MLRMLKIVQHCLAVFALLVAGVVGPETHVHPGKGPECETLVHAHAGVVGHTHASRKGLQAPGEEPAIYINAFCLISNHAPSFPIPWKIAVTLAVQPRRIANYPVQDNVPTAHAPPSIEFVHLRAPPALLAL